jgi:serine/threonine-protein kinase
MLQRLEVHVAGREGTRFGPYLLTRRLGGAAAGEVYLAEGQPTGTSSPVQVAVKVLSGSAADPTTREIAQQAELAGGLNQPHIIPFNGIVAHEGILGVSMAFAQGGSLGDALAATHPDGTRRVSLPLSIPVVARLIEQLARALAAAHAAGLVHADLKPNNVFVRTSPAGHPLAAVSDFGQAILTPSAVGILTRGDAADPRRLSWASAQLLFSAPEQVQGSGAQPATDQYALAALAYLLLTGAPPLDGDGLALLRDIPVRLVAPPSRVTSSLSPQLDAILLRALAKEPEQRFSSIADFAQALDAALAASASAGKQRSGVTAGFARLSGAHPAVGRPLGAVQSVPGSGSPALSGGQPGSVTGGLRPSDSPSPSAARATAPTAKPPVVPDDDTSPRANRRLAIIAGLAMLLVVLSCLFVFRAFTGGAILPQIQLGIGSSHPNATATAKPDASATTAARSAEQQLQAATAGSPRFQDPLTGNGQHWQTSPNTVFFAPDGLHLANRTADSTLVVDTPGAPQSYSTLAIRVDLAINQGKLNDFAGVRALVTPSGDYYAFLVSPEGKFQIWQRLNGYWTLFLDGFTPGFRSGLAQKNTLEVLVEGQSSPYPQAWFFVNGQLVSALVLDLRGPFAGGAGLIVLDPDAEAVYTNFVLYGSGG